MSEADAKEVSSGGAKTSMLDLTRKCAVCRSNLSCKLTRDEAGKIQASYRCTNTAAHARLANPTPAKAEDSSAPKPLPVIHYRRVQVTNDRLQEAPGVS